MERIRKYEPLWGKWVVKRKLGQGEFGTVYEVESEKFGNKSSCAVKIISFKNSEMLQGVEVGETLSLEKLEQLKMEEAKKNVREALLMDKLQGRNHIITIHDYDIFPGESTTDIVIRMELLTNLKDYMRLHKVDSEEELKSLVIKLGIDIGKALEECEEEKIVHRDIKPDNIFVNKNGSFKLGDFGLSRKMSKSASFSLRKSAGTPYYMAPEAFGWGRKTDYLSDIYSLGIVIYQLLNDGNIPFASDMKSYDEVDDAIDRRESGEELEPPKHAQGELWKVIQKACQYKKEDRYQHARELRKELEDIQNKSVVEKQKSEDTLDQEIIWKELSRMKKELERLQKNNKQQYSIGDSIFFGSYPQDADGTMRPIEWIILKKEENRILLLSKYILDSKPYNRFPVRFEKAEVELFGRKWETSDIRRWLNNGFYVTAFNDMERRKIQATYIKAENSREYGTDGENDTEDKIFLLSIKEVEPFLANSEVQNAKITEYVKKLRGDNLEHLWWWLRSTIKRSQARVDGDKIDKGEWATREPQDGVRPALWLNL